MKEYGQGLYPKYRVFKESSDEEINSFFVLRLKDKSARVAMKAYAEDTDNEILSKEILRWVSEYEKLSCIDPSRGYCNKVESPVCCAHCLKKVDCLMEGEMKCYLVEIGEVGDKNDCLNHDGI